MPKITEVQVTAARTFNDGRDAYTSFNPTIALTVAIGEGEDVDSAVKAAQAEAERLVEEHKAATLQALAELRQLEYDRQQLAALERSLQTTRSQIRAIRERNPELAGAAALPTPRHSEEGEDDDGEFVEPLHGEGDDSRADDPQH